MKIRLHDPYPLAAFDPITAAASLKGIKSTIDKFLKSVGGWSGLNYQILKIFGKDLAKDPQLIAGQKQSWLRDYGNVQGSSANLYLNRTKIDAKQIERLVLMLTSNIQQANRKAQGGDWVAARWSAVYANALKEVQQEIQARINAQSQINPPRNPSGPRTPQQQQAQTLLPIGLIAALLLS